MDAQEVDKSEDLIRDTCEVNGTILTVLYDSGASHSFISCDCMSTLQLPFSELSYELLVSTPTNELVRTNHICMNVSLQIGGRTFTANLIVFLCTNLTSFWVWIGSLPTKLC